ncbi:unnamed protein product [Ambrosiozyma monospora]|uniref:Unnamed protein product n=1 Tax=Ambrosiozyma monospora TaxID=43982 RepID=A0ACB5SR41_AMBMO|nr:unnamed protein product [Ambrosiozyma monospora]
MSKVDTATVQDMVDEDFADPLLFQPIPVEDQPLITPVVDPGARLFQDETSSKCCMNGKICLEFIRANNVFAEYFSSVREELQTHLNGDIIGAGMDPARDERDPRTNNLPTTSEFAFVCDRESEKPLNFLVKAKSDRRYYSVNILDRFFLPDGAIYGRSKRASLSLLQWCRYTL